MIHKNTVAVAIALLAPALSFSALTWGQYQAEEVIVIGHKNSLGHSSQRAGTTLMWLQPS